MKTKHLLTASVAALCAFTVLHTCVQAAALAYTVTDLGLGNGIAINASGQVSGGITSTGADHAARWTGTTLTDLGPLPGGVHCYGYGINASGQIAGDSSWLPDGFIHAVRWSGTTPTALGTLGDNNSSCKGINDSGQIAGSSQTTGGDSHAVRWTGTTPTDLGTIHGGGSSYGYGINASGQVSGYSVTYGPTDLLYAVRWTGTTPEELSPLAGISYSFANSINASGQVVGESRTADGLARAVRWTGTTPTDLGTLPGDSESSGYSINASGDVTGYSGVSQRPFIYTDGVMYDLTTLLLPGSGVTRLGLNPRGNNINDLGQIAAGDIIDGQWHALLLTPTPEPASAVLLLGGAALLGLRRRR